MPGVAKKKFDKELFNLKLELRRKVKDLCGVLPYTITYDEFYKYFGLCYEDWVEYFSSFKRFYDKKDKHLLSLKHKARYKCPNLEVLLSYHFNKWKVNNMGMSEKSEILDDKNYQLNIFIKRCSDEVRKRYHKQSSKEEIIQFVCPRFVQKIMGLYSHYRLKHSGNLNLRMQVLKEVAKYKTKETIAFLYAVNESEPDAGIRYVALQALQRFGVYCRFRSVQKKLRKDDEYLKAQVIDNPDDLNRIIDKDIVESMKRYNIFISHSTKDRNFLIDLVHDINKQGKNVYVDWMEDLEALQRSKTNAQTASVIKHRIDSSDVVLCIKTEGALLSEWVPWELGYADAIGKPIFVMDIDGATPVPAYMQLYQLVPFQDGHINVNDMLITKDKKNQN